MLTDPGGCYNPRDSRQVSAGGVGHELLRRHDILPVGAIANMPDRIERRPDIATRAFRGSIVAPAIAPGIQFIRERLKVKTCLLQVSRTVTPLHRNLLIRHITSPTSRCIVQRPNISISD